MASLLAQTVKNHLQSRIPGFNPWGGKIPWRRKWKLTPAFFLENSMDRSLVSYGVLVTHGVSKSRMRLCH